MDIEKELLDIVGNYVDIPLESINFDDGIKFAGLNSYGLLSMISDVEGHFYVSIPDSKLREFKTLRDIADFIKTQIC